MMYIDLARLTCDIVLSLNPTVSSQGGAFGGDPRDISELFASVIHDMGSASGRAVMGG